VLELFVPFFKAQKHCSRLKQISLSRTSIRLLLFSYIGDIKTLAVLNLDGYLEIEYSSLLIDFIMNNSTTLKAIQVNTKS
jgi:hypothetical protein